MWAWGHGPSWPWRCQSLIAIGNFFASMSPKWFSLYVGLYTYQHISLFQVPIFPYHKKPACNPGAAGRFISPKESNASIAEWPGDAIRISTCKSRVHRLPVDFGHWTGGQNVRHKTWQLWLQTKFSGRLLESNFLRHLKSGVLVSPWFGQYRGTCIPCHLAGLAGQIFTWHRGDTLPVPKRQHLTIQTLKHRAVCVAIWFHFKVCISTDTAVADWCHVKPIFIIYPPEFPWWCHIYSCIYFSIVMHCSYPG